MSALLALGLPSPAEAGDALDVMPVLTSTPFGAAPGQQVTHTITLSATGSGTLPAARVTFTTTIDLDGVTATTSAGSCLIVTPLTVVCELGNVDLSDSSAAAPKVTIAGTIHPGAAPGTLVQNLVNVTSGTPDANPSNNVASNAYLVGGGGAAPVSAPSGSLTPAHPLSSRVARRGSSLVPVIAAVVVAILAVTTLIVLRRRHRSADV